MKLYICALFVLTGSLSFSQYKIRTVETDYIHRGMITVGGNLSFSNQTFDKQSENRTEINFTPSFSYFITDKFSAGISGLINNLKVGPSNTTDWGIGPSLRYYLSGRKFAPFFGAGYSYGVSELSANNDKFKTSRIILSGGVDYFLAKNVAVEGTLDYQFITEKYPERYSQFFSNLEFKSRQILIAFGINIFI